MVDGGLMLLVFNDWQPEVIAIAAAMVVSKANLFDLLRAYQGLGNNEKVDALLLDLQKRFSFGQHNINDRIQLY